MATTVASALNKHETLARVVEAKDVPLSVKLAAVVYETTGNTMVDGARSLGAIAEMFYGIARSMTAGHDEAMQVISAAINESAVKSKNLNG